MNLSLRFIYRALVNPSPDPSVEARLGLRGMPADASRRVLKNNGGNGEGLMSPAIINLIVQLISGAVGGNAAGKVNPSFDLGALANTIVGALGGVGGGYLLSTFLPNLISTAEG